MSIWIHIGSLARLDMILWVTIYTVLWSKVCRSVRKIPGLKYSANSRRMNFGSNFLIFIYYIFYFISLTCFFFNSNFLVIFSYIILKKKFSKFSFFILKILCFDSRLGERWEAVKYSFSVWLLAFELGTGTVAFNFWLFEWSFWLLLFWLKLKDLWLLVFDFDFCSVILWNYFSRKFFLPTFDFFHIQFLQKIMESQIKAWKNICFWLFL